MALEVKVYREITEYQAKVIFGLSWRQAGSLLAALPVIIGAYLLCYWNGLDDLGVVVITVLVVPVAAFGWARPMGIEFEKYIGYYWAFRQGPKYFAYAGLPVEVFSSGMEKEEDSEKQEVAKALPRRTRWARKKFAAFEATN